MTEVLITEGIMTENSQTPEVVLVEAGNTTDIIPEEMKEGKKKESLEPRVVMADSMDQSAHRTDDAGNLF